MSKVYYHKITGKLIIGWRKTKDGRTFPITE